MPTNKSNNNKIGKAFAIGTNIEYNGKSYEVTESNQCCDCSLAAICSSNDKSSNIKGDLLREERIKIFGECSSIKRPDTKSVVFVEVPNTSKEEYYKVIPLYIDDKSIQLRPVEFDLPNGYEIDKENSDLSKGIIKFKNKWLTIEQLYKLAKNNNYHTCLSEIKNSTGYKTSEVREKLIALSNLMDIANYFNGDWKFDSEKDTQGYAIAFYYNTTEYPQYNVIAIHSTSDIYYGNPIFKNEADAQYVIDNPNFRDILDNIFKV